jgi:dihydroorotate dehydrogenase (NAD+) catalytic subunit
MKPDLSVEIAGIRMKNPVMNASGTLDLIKHHEFGLMDISRLGAYVHKSIDYDGREGNDQPRLYEVASGIINRIGLQNPGVINFVEEILPQICAVIKVPLIVSIAGKSINDYIKTAVFLEEKASKRINGFEINISCPNVKDGMVFGTNPNLTFKLVSGLRSRVNLPLIVKLTPNVTDIGKIALASEEAGADAVSLINTVKGRAYIRRGPHAGMWIEGGLSGPAIKPIALAKIADVLRVVKIPVIGMGGIFNTEDALDFFRLGVSAIAIGTANFTYSDIIVKIIDGLNRYLKEKGYANLNEFKEREGLNLTPT